MKQGQRSQETHFLPCFSAATVFFGPTIGPHFLDSTPQKIQGIGEGKELVGVRNCEGNQNPRKCTTMTTSSNQNMGAQ